MSNESITLEECVHGHLYEIHSRNLTVGVFREGLNGFIGIREKFGDHYLFTEYHYDIGGTVHAKKDLGLCPIENLREGESKDNMWHENKELFSWLEGVIPDGE